MGNVDPRWWLVEETDGAHSTIIELVRALDQDLEEKRERMMRCARLYDPTAEFMGSDIEFKTGPYPLDRGGPATMNVVRSVVDTVTSMIAKNRPRAAFVTDGADWSTAERSKGLEKFIEGEFQRTEIYYDAVRVFRDACIAGLGALKIFEEDNRASIERVIWEELTVDEAECRAGPPRQLHQTKFVDRSMLKVLYPDFEDEIDAACTSDISRRWTSYRHVEEQLVPVIESWHLRSTPDSDDGVHAIVIEGATLVWESYTKDYFPFVFYRWAEKLTGFWGCGLAEELAGIQNRINKINNHIGRCHDFANSFMVCGAEDAALTLRPVRGQPFQSITYKAPNPPQFVTPTLVQQELYSHLQFLMATAYQIAGVSELSAHSQLPAGMDKASGIAIQTFADIETQRFSIQAQRYEAMFLEAARQYVAIAKEIAERKGEYKAVWNTRNKRRSIDWGDVDMENDLYTISIEAASLLSRTPAGRIQAAIELANAALLERDELRHLIGHPDLERTLSLKDAALDHAMAVVEQLNRAEYVPPEPLDNLAIAVPVVSNAFLKAKDGKAPENVLDTYRLWLRAAVDVLSPPEQMAPPGTLEGQPMPGAPGQGVPEQPPSIPTPPQMEPGPGVAPPALA